MISLILLLALTLLGYSWTSSVRGGLLLAPALGLAATVLLSYFVSANFGLVGADAVAIVIPTLFVLMMLREWLLRKSYAQRYAVIRTELYDAGSSQLPVIILLVPAFLGGITDFFGVGNFDFFYNSQDGLFLASHSVNDYVAETEDRILPLTWSANPQGRFAVTLLSAFAYKYVGLNPLHFNAALLSTCVSIAALAAFAFARRLLALRSIWALLATFSFILSAGFAQGYSYFLLGQISALPLFLAMAISFGPTLDSWGDANVQKPPDFWRNAIVIALWLNALYVFYAILAFFGGALFVLAASLKARGTGAWKASIVRICMVLGTVTLLFLLIRLFSLPSAAHAIFDWVLLSFKTAGAGSDGPKVFTEYLTEGSFALLMGLVRYPATQSIFGSLLWFQGSQSLPLLAMSFVGIVSFLFATRCFFASHDVPSSGKAILGGLVMLSMACGLAFFISGSGYAMFKIGSWFIPICLMATVVALAARNQFSTAKRRALMFMGCGLIGLNMITAFNYVYAFLPLTKVFGYQVDSKIVNMRDIEQLKTSLQSDRPLHLDFLDGIKAAWFANEFRDYDVQAYSHNLQPLADRLVSAPVCPVNASRSYTQAYLVTDHPLDNSEDVISMQPAPKLSHTAGKYRVIDMAELEFYVSLGRGTYPSYTLSEDEVKNTGFPRTMRWVEKGFELYVFAREPGIVSIYLEAAPGYVVGPENRTLKLSNGSVEKIAPFSKLKQQVRFDNVQVNAGMNCMFIESTDDVKNIKRYGALFRDTVTLDSRFLNYVIGNLKADYQR